MKKKTDIVYVRHIAEELLYVDIQETEFEMFLVHPFFNQRYIMLHKDDKILTDILASPENLDRARKIYKAMIHEADLWRIVWLMHKPYRPLLFKLVQDHLSVEDYNEMLCYVWTGTENPNQDVNVSISQWIRYFKKADMQYLMNDEEREFYDKLSDGPITIYRGVGYQREPYGLSWTINEDTARWFANRWENKKAYMFKGKCFKKDVLAYFNGRGEDELVVSVKNIFNIERINFNE